MRKETHLPRGGLPINNHHVPRDSEFKAGIFPCGVIAKLKIEGKLKPGFSCRIRDSQLKIFEGYLKDHSDDHYYGNGQNTNHASVMSFLTENWKKILLPVM